VEAHYADLLKAQPLKPISFTLNFVLDSTSLTDESRDLLPAVIAAARARRPTEITVFGHADASGSERHNVKLSAERARLVAGLLHKADPTLDEIDVQWFGDRQPLVPSETREARNRRVEIVIL
jgi:outer membrane protein OmpA-like peptidoglycan-associated protein